MTKPGEDRASDPNEGLTTMPVPVPWPPMTSSEEIERRRIEWERRPLTGEERAARSRLTLVVGWRGSARVEHAAALAADALEASGGTVIGLHALEGELLPRLSADARSRIRLVDLHDAYLALNPLTAAGLSDPTRAVTALSRAWLAGMRLSADSSPKMTNLLELAAAALVDANRRGGDRYTIHDMIGFFVDADVRDEIVEGTEAEWVSEMFGPDSPYSYLGARQRIEYAGPTIRLLQSLLSGPSGDAFRRLDSLVSDGLWDDCAIVVVRLPSTDGVLRRFMPVWTVERGLGLSAVVVTDDWDALDVALPSLASPDGPTAVVTGEIDGGALGGSLRSWSTIAYALDERTAERVARVYGLDPGGLVDRRVDPLECATGRRIPSRAVTDYR